MVGCFVFATIISALSIFAFFGNAFADTGGIAIPNMFQLMFGSTGTYHGYIVGWRQVGGLTFLFVLEIIIIIIDIITWFVCKIAYEDGPKIECATFSGICSLIALIISFCTLPITNVDRAKLGFGPIFYSVLNIISVLFIICGIIYYFVEENHYRYRSSYVPKSNYSSSYYVSSSSSTRSASSTQGTQKQKLSEKEKADLLMKYKGLLDSGLLTKEEFDAKKKEIL